MSIVLALLAGAALGVAVALINYRIMKNSIKKNTNSAVLAGSSVRMLVDVAALALIFLLRNVLPFSYELCMITAAIIMGAGSFYFSFKIARS